MTEPEQTELFDVLVVGGGPVGLAAAYEVAKRDNKVIVLEQNNFFNSSGTSSGLGRMFRTMYTDKFMSEFALSSMKEWDTLEADANVALRWMSGLLLFGDGHISDKESEDKLISPVNTLDLLGLSYRKLDASEIEEKYPFKNLDHKWTGLFAPDNGVINVQLLVRTLFVLARDHGVLAKDHTQVKQIRLSDEDKSIWEVNTISLGRPVTFRTKKIIIASGTSVNNILKPNFGISLDLNTWEIVSVNFQAVPHLKINSFPSVWFRLVSSKDGRVKSFYGIPALPWEPPEAVRLAIGTAARRIDDPAKRKEVSERDMADIHDFARDHITGIDHHASFSTVRKLQKNTFDERFILDFIPQKYLHGGPDKSIAVFTAGWAMKFIPVLGKALSRMILDGESEYAREEFSIARRNPETGKCLIVEEGKKDDEAGYEG